MSVIKEVSVHDELKRARDEFYDAMFEGDDVRMMDAKKEAEKTGKRMKISYATGGKVEMYQDQLRRKYHGK